MKSAKLMLLLVGVVLSAGSAVGVSPAHGYEVIEVSPSVVMAENERGSNFVCVALADGLIFVDTGLSTSNAAAFRAKMEQRFKRETQALLLTHGHLDHFLGMGAFADVRVIAAAVGKPLFEYQLSIEFDEKTTAVYSGIFPTFAEDVVEAKPFLPTEWFDQEIRLGPKGGQIVFRNTGGHSADSSSVFFEKEGVLVSGDLVQVEKYPYFGDRTTDLDAWIRTMKTWHDMEIQQICPGHGRVVDREYLKPIWQYFESLLATLAKLKRSGTAIEEAVAHPDLPKGYWPDGGPEPRWWKMCIARAYQSLEIPAETD